MPQEKIHSHINTALHQYSSDLKQLDLELSDFYFYSPHTAESVVEGKAAGPLDSALIFHMLLNWSTEWRGNELSDWVVIY